MIIKHTSRRNFFKITSITITGLLGGAYTTANGKSDGNEGWFKTLFGNSKNNKEPIPGIPQSWIDFEGDVVYEYANYILDLKLKNITPQMVIAPHFKKRGSIKNTLPPKKLWKKMKPTLLVIDALSESMGTPINDIISEIFKFHLLYF